MARTIALCIAAFSALFCAVIIMLAGMHTQSMFLMVIAYLMAIDALELGIAAAWD